jgi:hypothetical protein
VHAFAEGPEWFFGFWRWCSVLLGLIAYRSDRLKGHGGTRFRGIEESALLLNNVVLIGPASPCSWDHFPAAHRGDPRNEDQRRHAVFQPGERPAGHGAASPHGDRSAHRLGARLAE